MQTYYQNGAPLGYYPGVPQPYNPAYYYPGSPPPPVSPVLGPAPSPQPVPYASQASPTQQFHPELSNQDTFIPSGGEEQPPEFEPYVAKYKVSSSGCVVSHDPHLNEDGEALYRFLLSHAQNRPRCFVSIHGDHVEQHTRKIRTTDSDGHTTTRTETHYKTVTDFDFNIDITQYISSGPVHWSLPDNEPAFRGRMFKEVDKLGPSKVSLDGQNLQTPRIRRKATGKERRNTKAWREERESGGLPPWVAPSTTATGMNEINNPEMDPTRTNVLLSSKTLREWADEYCASKQKLKEFTYEKVVYGWDLGALRSAIRSVIAEVYSGNYTVGIHFTHNRIHVRPDTSLSRALDNGFLKFLMCISGVYPCIWMYKRFSENGGGKWKVCGGAYAFKCWRPFVAPPPGMQVTVQGRVLMTNVGLATLIGMKEGEWLQIWERAIRRGVTSRLKGGDTYTSPEAI